MSNLPQQLTINQYGPVDGVQTIFNYTYLILLATDIQVYVTPPGQPADPASDIKVLNVDYTVQNVGTLDGGTITFTDAPPISSIVTISRNILASIDTEFVNVQTINGQNLDNAFLREMMVIQQAVTDLQQRVLRYAVDSYLPNLPANTTLPVLTNVQNQIWKSQGSAIIATVLEENPDVGTLRTDLANNTMGGDGASIVGYYDTHKPVPTTVAAFLNSLDTTFISRQFFQDTGTVNAIKITIPNYTAYTTGDYFRVRIANTNTIEAPTFQVNSLTPFGFYSLSAGDLQANQIYEFIIQPDGVNVINPSVQKVFYGASVKNSASQVIAAGTNEDVNLTTAVIDPFSIFDGTAHTITVLNSGIYDINFSVPITSVGFGSAAAFVVVNIKHNSDVIPAGKLKLTNNVDVGPIINGTITLSLAANDVIKLNVDNQMADPIDIYDSTYMAYLTVSFRGV